MDAGTTVLHFASDTDDSAFAIGDCGSIKQFHQVRHQALAEHCTSFEQRSQILDVLTGEGIADHGHAHGPRGWPICLDAKLRKVVSRVVMILRISIMISSFYSHIV